MIFRLVQRVVIFIALAMGVCMELAIAQMDEDVYDPFVDYSEFEEASEEEADINFFKNGRFFTVGANFGYRRFTDVLGQIYSDTPTYGFYLSYFFDLRFALQLSFSTGDHSLRFSTSGQTVTGTVAISSTTLAIKYFFNTQNVVKGLADLNPYVVGGFGQVVRTSSVTGQTAFAKDQATAVEIGGGIEIPMLRNKMYFGLQATYQMASFKDEGNEIVLAGNVKTGIYPKGDIIHLTSVLGVNF